MADAELTLDLTDSKHEESGDSPTDEGDAEPQQTQENTNGVKTDAEEKPEPKEKSRKSHRYHPYKERHGGGGSADKKAAHRNRVFISNIPYDMKWQAIKDLMREKGNPRRDGAAPRPRSVRHECRPGELPVFWCESACVLVVFAVVIHCSDDDDDDDDTDVEGLYSTCRGMNVALERPGASVTKVPFEERPQGSGRRSQGDPVPRPLLVRLHTWNSLRMEKESQGVVEFKDEEFVKKAIEVMSKHDLNGRPLNIKEDPDGEHARRVLQRSGRMYGGGRGQDTGPTGMNVPPSIANNPNIPPEIISALQAGRLGTTVFVANYGGDGEEGRCQRRQRREESRNGNGHLRAAAGGPMFNGQMLFDRQMHVKMDDKSLPPDDFRPAEKPPQLPRGLGGVGMGLGPGGQPINANRLSGGAVGSMGPGGMDGPGCSNMNRMSGMGGGFSGMDCVGGMGGFGGRDMGPMSRMGGGGYTGMGNAGMGPMGSGLGGGGMVNMGMDRMNSGFDRMGGNMDMGRGFGQYGGGSGHMGGMSDRGVGSKAGCQIFVRNLSYDLTWQKLKEKFSHCGQVMYAEIKMENGKSKGCGTVRFDSPESAEKACRMMNGTKINGREVDVRIDRNA
ncbi:Myelin expression factor 2 [Labeo rohita]|uniref:Myelin expression factor 2 n=1 Tax=Labeo rohita TaxID=84645 RepID=A0ABQ8LS91_LABRO|nr:Myelin expression factor 2 [Labeo rohita]